MFTQYNGNEVDWCCEGGEEDKREYGVNRPIVSLPTFKALCAFVILPFEIV